MKHIIFLLIITNWATACVNSQKSSNAIANDNCPIIDNYLSKLAIEKNFSGGLLIIKDGKQLLSKGYGWADKANKIPFSSSTLASIGSITKAFTATAIMKLVEQNKLTVDDKLNKFFPTMISQLVGWLAMNKLSGSRLRSVVQVVSKKAF